MQQVKRRRDFGTLHETSQIRRSLGDILETALDKRAEPIVTFIRRGRPQPSRQAPRAG